MDQMQQKIEKIFNRQKAGLIANLEIAKNHAHSWNTLLDIKHLYHAVTDKDLTDFDKVLKAADDVEAIYENTLNIVKNMGFDVMALGDTNCEFKNPIDEVVEFNDPESWEDVFHQALLNEAAAIAGNGIEKIRARLISERDEGTQHSCDAKCEG